jgi:hypothetical protein
MGDDLAVAAKRRVLVDALTVCLERSKVGEIVSGETLRSVLNAASTELWREGEFRLEYVWKILCQEPGLSAEQVAPPLLVFKAYEGELQVPVRLPEALSAVPRSEQARLRDQLGLGKQELTNALAELQRIAAAEEKKANEAMAAAANAERRAASAPDAAKRNDPAQWSKAPPAKSKISPGVAVALLIVSLISLGIGLWITFRPTAIGMDVSDVAGILKLDNAVRAGPSMNAILADPKWDSLPKEERERLAGKLFEVEAAKGIQAMSLQDPSGRSRVTAFEADGHRTVVVY